MAILLKSQSPSRAQVGLSRAVEDHPDDVAGDRTKPPEPFLADWIPGATTAELILDSTAVLTVSLAICIVADELLFMTLFVPLVMIARTVCWNGLIDRRKHALSTEILFLVSCTGLGAFNDWNTVVRHEVYDYCVPCYFPGFSEIPIWMLLFWGLILRLMYTVVTWRPGGAPGPWPSQFGFGRFVVHSRPMRLVVLLMLVLVTRQTVYRLFLDPLFSWLPFAAAIVFYALVLGVGRREMVLAGAAVTAGAVIEGAYVLIGGLHTYRLEWLLGLPAWIILWWALAVLVWREVGALLHRSLTLAVRRLP